MKCPACGYHNPPGISGCARCGPVAPARTVPEVPEVPETFYPPRARDVTTVQRVRERLASVVPPPGSLEAAPAWSVRLHELVCALAVVLAALLPGAGQALQQRWARAAQLGAGCCALAALFLVLLRRPASDVVLGLLFVLELVSVGDVVAHIHPPCRMDEVDDLRTVLLGWGRIALCSIGVVSAAAAAGFWVLGQEYTPWRVTTDWLETTFREGDTLLVQRPPRLANGVRHGEIVTYQEATGPGLERVLALPGERISLDRGGLRVSGNPVPGAARIVSAGAPFNTRVPAETLAVSVEDGSGTPVRFVPFAAVRGKVIAILQPAERRSWLR